MIAVMSHRGQQGHPSSSQRSMVQRLIPWVLPFCLYPLPPSSERGASWFTTPRIPWLPQPHSPNRVSLAGVPDQSSGKEETSGPGEGSARYKSGFLTISTSPAWGQNLALEVQGPAPVWGRGLPPSSPTSLLRAEGLPLAVTLTLLFPRIRGFGPAGKSCGEEPLPAQP